MAIASTEQRKLILVAILDYDDIPESDRVGYLMQTCKLSKYLAVRLLQGQMPRDIFKICDVADALDVDFNWLLRGFADTFHPRTFRINAQRIKHYPKQDTDKMVRLLVAAGAGMRKACNLLDLVNADQMTLRDAARLF